MVFKKRIFSTFSDLKELENDFESFLRVNRVPSDGIYDLKMAVHEYLLNIMEHGYHWIPDKTIEFEAEVKMKGKKFEISITIQDHAPKFEISREKVLKSIDNKSFRGRGLLMILTFIDDIIYDYSFQDGNRVTMTKSILISS
ncbi:MAG: ATP-binding protein [Brevinematales bacterium]|nr:ATP-binding protein [Brevinematales bacterium]